MKLIISCFINGLVHEESDRIYAVLDQLNGENLNEKEYKEWIMFKNASKEMNFGFTIGGFAALRKTTLIPVMIYFETINIINLLTIFLFDSCLHSY